MHTRVLSLLSLLIATAHAKDAGTATSRAAAHHEEDPRAGGEEKPRPLRMR
ncbi:MAG: hypothetical protein QM755_01000 [Luteolibacter sp.]